jgi:hypothetical protein
MKWKPWTKTTMTMTMTARSCRQIFGAVMMLRWDLRRSFGSLARASWSVFACCRDYTGGLQAVHIQACYLLGRGARGVPAFIAQ